MSHCATRQTQLAAGGSGPTNVIRGPRRARHNTMPRRGTRVGHSKGACWAWGIATPAPEEAQLARCPSSRPAHLARSVQTKNTFCFAGHERQSVRTWSVGGAREYRAARGPIKLRPQCGGGRCDRVRACSARARTGGGVGGWGELNRALCSALTMMLWASHTSSSGSCLTTSAGPTLFPFFPFFFFPDPFLFFFGMAPAAASRGPRRAERSAGHRDRGGTPELPGGESPQPSACG